MIRNVLVAALAACALTAPAAHADPPHYDCDLVLVEDVTREAGWYIGHVRGYVVHSGGSEVTIRCTLAVNGGTPIPVASATGTAAAVTGPQVVNFPATASDDVELCAIATTIHGTNSTCYEPTRVPPQLFWDIGCPVLVAADQRLGTNLADDCG